MQTFSDNITQKRLSFIRRHPLYVSSLHRLEELEKTRIFCRHQTEHLLDVARIAYILNLEGGLGLSRDLIYTAALLHDIGKSRQYEEGIPHETASADLAERILSDMPSDLAFTAEEQLQILTAIRGHRKPRSGAGPLESLLYKSDKMSRTCFACPAEPECNWDSAKKNTEIQL
ncbi:MAG: HD domain-containing protein [Dorea sp.]|nr:HD domain-containing protein [Dorea sp.]